MRIDVALASCAELPEPDADEAPTLDALKRAGLSAETIAWDGDDPDRAARARLVLLRATWNYPERPHDFLAWVDRTSRATALWNPARVVHWNTHKSYLLALDARGVPAVPTHLVQRASPETLAGVMRSRGWSDVVVKPAVSAASRLTMRARDIAPGEAHLRAVLAEGDALVQPYVASVEDHGERAIVWIDGEPTHAVRKSPRFAGDEERTSDAIPIADDEADVARRAVACATREAGPILYARVDVARDSRGQPRVMELELIEPSLFLAKSERALRRLVTAVTRRLKQ